MKTHKNKGKFCKNLVHVQHMTFLTKIETLTRIKPALII